MPVEGSLDLGVRVPSVLKDTSRSPQELEGSVGYGFEDRGKFRGVSLWWKGL